MWYLGSPRSFQGKWSYLFEDHVYAKPESTVFITFSELAHDQEGKNTINLPSICVMVTQTVSPGASSFLLIIAKHSIMLTQITDLLHFFNLLRLYVFRVLLDSQHNV